jgi:excisionase family DNA binding protein
MRRGVKTIGVLESARRMGVTGKHVYDLVRERKLAAEKVGRQWRISLDAVKAWLSARGK